MKDCVVSILFVKDLAWNELPVSTCSDCFDDSDLIQNFALTLPECARVSNLKDQFDGNDEILPRWATYQNYDLFTEVCHTTIDTCAPWCNVLLPIVNRIDENGDDFLSEEEMFEFSLEFSRAGFIVVCKSFFSI